MSEEISSSSVSSSSSSASCKSAAPMKRQNENNGANAENSEPIIGSGEETKSVASPEIGCKRRRKSVHNNNNNNDVDLSVPDTYSAAGGDGTDSLNSVGKNRTRSMESSTDVVDLTKAGIESNLVDHADEAKMLNDGAASLIEILDSPVENCAKATAVTESSSVNSTNVCAPIGDGVVDNEIVVVDSDTAEQGSAPNSPSPTNQRQCRIRRRSYRRAIPEMSSASASPTQGEANNDGNNLQEEQARDSDDDDSEDIDPFILPYNTQSSDSNDDLNSIGSEELYIQSSEDDGNEENLAMLDDVDENNGEVGDDVHETRHVYGLVDKVLNKSLSACKWNTTMEIMWREHGISNRYSGRPRSHSKFNSGFYASQFVVERMKLLHCLRRHNGCVNSLNFNRSGSLLCSGSDDKCIIVWDWSRKKFKHIFRSGHKENIFQTKFISSDATLDIVSAGRDGQVRRAIIRPSGKGTTSCLYKHRNAVHKIVVCPNSQNEILSVGEDGFIRHCDLRSSANSLGLLKVLSSKRPHRTVRLFSIAHHPYTPEVCVCGSDEYVLVYDKRKFDQPVHKMCPSHLANSSASQVTCCTYNHNGTEILATYCDEQIYLFDNVKYTPGSFLHDYCGHYNNRTIKGVNFFGPNSEYVISGSDCGNVFFWDKQTEAIINIMSADSFGVVNCLEPHPSIPVLATSGLDYTVKVWTPGSERTCPDKDKIKDCIMRNIWRSSVEGRNELSDSAINDAVLGAIHVFDSEDDSLTDSSSIFHANDLDNTSSTSSSSSNSTNATQSTENNENQYFTQDSDDTSDNDNDDDHLTGLTCRTQ